MRRHPVSAFCIIGMSAETDIAIMKRDNGYAVHCPDATTNIIAGIIPAAVFQDQGFTGLRITENTQNY